MSEYIGILITTLNICSAPAISFTCHLSHLHCTSSLPMTAYSKSRPGSCTVHDIRVSPTCHPRSTRVSLYMRRPTSKLRSGRSTDCRVRDLQLPKLPGERDCARKRKPGRIDAFARRSHLNAVEPAGTTSGLFWSSERIRLLVPFPACRLGRPWLEKESRTLRPCACCARTRILHDLR